MKKRVKIPTNAAQLVTLANHVKDKHTADGDASMLKILNWQEVGPMIDEATALHEKTEQLKRELLESYQKRSLKLDNVVKFLRNSRDILTGVNDTEMKVLGQWGYDVFDSRSTKAATPAVVTKQGAIAQHSAMV